MSSRTRGRGGVLEVDVTKRLFPMLKPSRYKALYGGRGGGKSHFFAEQIVLRCFKKKTRVVCIREVQTTIRDSVRQLIIDKIEKFGLQSQFKVLDNEIKARNGSLIIFKGMQDYNSHNIKSLEGFDIAWVEEAQTFSETSLKLLRPTIRKDGAAPGDDSELWFSWNPRHDTDAVDKFFRGQKPPKNAIILSVNWYDNPLFPKVLQEEKDQDFENDPDDAEHVWGGGYEVITEGAYYSRQLAAVTRENRIGFYPYIPGLPVFTSWDLGVDDYTAIWFFQIHEVDGKTRVRIIDYYEAQDFGADDVVRECMPEYTEDLQDRISQLVEIDRDDPYTYGRHFLPHDIGVREWGNGAKTRIQSLVSLGVPLGKINRGVAQKDDDRINAVRRLLPICEFHQTGRVMKGMARLRRFRKKFNKLLNTYQGPLNDENCHAADAFGEFAVNCGLVDTKKKSKDKANDQPPPGSVRPPPVVPRSRDRIEI